MCKFLISYTHYGEISWNPLESLDLNNGAHRIWIRRGKTIIYMLLSDALERILYMMDWEKDPGNGI